MRIGYLCVCAVLCLAGVLPVRAESQGERITALLGQLKGGDEAARTTAINALQTIGTPAVPFLLSVCDHPDVQVRRGVMQVFTNLRDARTFPTLVTGLQDADAAVRWYAGVALEHSPHPQRVEALLTALSSRDVVLVAELMRTMKDDLPWQPRFATALLARLKQEDWPRLVNDVDAVLARHAPPAPAQVHAWMGDPVPGVRGLAVTVIERQYDPDGASDLVPLLADASASVRVVAAAAAIGYPDVRVIASLRGLLFTTDPQVRAAAASSLGWLRDEPSFPLLLDLLDDPSPVVRRHAIDGLQYYHRREAVLPVAAFLIDSDKNTRRQAATMCADAYVPDVAEKLVAALRAERDDFVLAALVRAIGMQADPATIDPLDAIARDRENPARLRAITALGLLGNARATPTLLSMLADANKDIRIEAIRACARVKDPQAVEALLPSLQSASDQEHEETCAALAAIGDKRAIAPMIASFNRKWQDRWEGRIDCGAALARLCGDDIPALASALHCSNVRLRSTVATALGNSHDPRAVQPLLDALAHSQAETPRMPDYLLARFPQALGALKDPRAIPALARVYQLEVVGLREAAATALATIGGPEVAPILLTQAHHPNPRIREIAVRALEGLKDPRGLPAALEALHDDDAGVRYFTAQGIDAFAADDLTPIITALLPCLTDPAAVLDSRYIDRDDPLVVSDAAAETLDRLRVTPVSEAVLERLTAKDWRQRYYAAKALGTLRDGRAVPGLLHLLDERNDEVRIAAITALGRIGDQRAVAPLLAMLKTNFQHPTVEALGQLHDPRVVEAITPLLTSANYWTATTAVPAALAALGDARAIPPLLHSLRSRKACPEVITALAALHAREAVSALINALYQQDYTSPDAAHALAQLGDPAAAPALTHMLELPYLFKGFTCRDSDYDRCDVSVYREALEELSSGSMR